MKTRSRKSFHTSNAAPDYSLKRAMVNNISNKVSQKMVPGTTVEGKILLCLQQYFAVLSTGIWWQILSLKDNFDNISVGIDNDWDDLLPLLLHYGLLYRENRHMINKYLVSSIMWTTFFTIYLLDK